MNETFTPRELQHKRRKPKSQTPGHQKRSDTCSTKKIGGVSRKAYCSGRGYKLPNYHMWVAHCDKVN